MNNTTVQSLDYMELYVEIPV